MSALVFKMSLGIRHVLGPHPWLIMRRHGRVWTGLEGGGDPSRVSIPPETGKVNQWSRSPVKVRWPEEVQLDMLWQKHKLTTNDRWRAISKRSRNSEVGEGSTGAAFMPAEPRGGEKAWYTQLTNEKCVRVTGMNPCTEGCSSHAMWCQELNLHLWV